MHTTRLTLRELTHDDAKFIFKLTNSPGWLEYIGDRNIKNLDDARNYISNGPIASYQQHGFGLYLIQLKENNTKVGLCGLLKRGYFDHPDLGFALLPQFTNQGYAYEASLAIIDNAKTVLGLNKLVASTDPNNLDSIKLLEKLGFRFEKQAIFSDDYGESKLFSLTL